MTDFHCILIRVLVNVVSAAYSIPFTSVCPSLLIGMTLLTSVSLPSLLVAASLLSLGSALVVWFRQKYKYRYENVGRIKKLVVYPVKSLQGVEVDFLDITKTGVRYGAFRDRSWVITNSEGVLVNAKVDARVALLKTSLHEDQLWIDAPNDIYMSTLKLQLKTKVSPEDKISDLSILGATIKGLDCGEEATQWLDTFLGATGMKMYQHIQELGHTPSRTWGKQTSDYDKQFPMVYQNYSDVHMICESSLIDLNTRIAQNSGLDFQANESHFRPNIIVEGSLAWEEDHWLQARVREVQMVQVMNCNRCAQTTVSRENAKKGAEPLKTLRKFRLSKDPKELKRLGSSPLFGCIFGTITEGYIEKGDEVDAIRVAKI